MKEKQPSLSCFFPCYNDACTIGGLVAVADRVAQAYTDEYEIIVVDDGSSDRSREVLIALKAKYPMLKLVFHNRNRGYGGALQSGLCAATGDLVFYTDGDGQYDVRELRKLLEAMRADVDVVNGYKIARSDPFHRVVIGKLYLQVMRMLFRFQVRDVDCDFRLMRRQVLDCISLTRTSGVICVELVKKLELAGARFVNVPVGHHPRRYGRSQFFHLGRVFRTGIDVLRLWGHIVLIPCILRLFHTRSRSRGQKSHPFSKGD